MISAHPRTWFPFVLIVLTLGLLILILFLYEDPSEQEVESNASQSGYWSSQPVSEDEYKVQVQEIVTTLDQQLASTLDEAQELVYLETAKDRLFSLVVPAGYQDSHLEMAIAINKITSGHITKDSEEVGQGYQMWSEAIDSNGWLE
jgi:hypothetical protein